MSKTIQQRDARLRNAVSIVFVTLLFFAINGCSLPKDVNSDFGKVNSSSVNGMGAFAQMFRDAGFRVSTWRRLSPKLEKEDVIVWAPDNYDCPNKEILDYLNDWLNEGHGRTLIYVGRNSLAEIDYWKSVQQQATGQQKIETRRKIAHLRAERKKILSGGKNVSKCDWFEFKNLPRVREVQNTKGMWSRSIDLEAADLNWSVVVQPTDSNDRFDEESLIATDEGNQLLRMSSYYGGKVFITANASFLVNLSLVNREHQQIARMLIRECSGERVTFLESDYGLLISESDASVPFMLKAFTVAPLKYLVLHLTILGFLYCLYISPIFGRPKAIVENSPSDFGRHITAFGELLQKGSGADFVRHALKHFRDSQGK